MRYHFSSPTGMMGVLRAYNVKNFLVSFAHSKNPPRQFNEHDNVIIDSGAFSVWHSGIHVDLDEYLSFCKLCPQSWWFVNLDVIPQTGSPQEEIKKCIERSKENYLFLSKHLKNVLPVHHYGETFEVLEWYKMRTNYLGISPANDTNAETKKLYLNDVFARLGMGVKTHGFGFSSFAGLTQFPFYSIDSTSFKYLAVSNEQNRKMAVRHAQQLQYLTGLKIKKILAQEKFITELWEKRGVVFD